MRARSYWLELVIVGAVVSLAALEIYAAEHRERRRIEWRAQCVQSGGQLVGTDAYAVCVYVGPNPIPSQGTEP